MAVISLQSGCTHNYYYGSNGCPPVGPTVATQVGGQVCEVPSGTVVTSGTAAPVVSGTVVPGQTVIVNPSSQPVVTSIPTYRSGISRSIGAWRAPSPESMARTTSEGGVDETINR